MWQKITLEMKAQIEAIRLKDCRITSAYHFTSLFVWQHEMGLKIWLEKDGYWIAKRELGEHHYFFPCGNHAFKDKILHSLPPGAVLHYASKADVAYMNETQPFMCDIKIARDDWEYLYEKEKQIALPGHRYKSLRKDTRRFCTMKNWHVKPIDTNLLNELRGLEQNRKIFGGDMQSVVETTLLHFEALSFVGLVGYVENDIIGYIAGVYLDNTVFCGIVLRSIAMMYYPALRYELFKSLSEHVITINMEEDMGLENLRKNKLLLHPDSFNEMFEIRKVGMKLES